MSFTTGTIVTRKPQIVTIASEEEAYDLLNDADAGFDPEEDVADAASAGHVHDALLRMLGELDGASETIGTAYHKDWIEETMSALSIRWDI